MKSILDKSFKYIPAAQTSVAKTFARIRREMEAEGKRLEAEKFNQVFKIRAIGSRG